MLKLFERAASGLSHLLHGDELSRKTGRLLRAHESALKEGRDPEKDPFCRKLEKEVSQLEAQRARRPGSAR